MFINIRGTFGSGKTTVVRSIMDAIREYRCEENYVMKKTFIKDKDYDKCFATIFHNIHANFYEGCPPGPTDRTMTRKTRKPVLFIGKYGEAQCGGADTMSWKGAHEHIEKYIMEHAVGHHIIIEGSITSGGSRYNRIGQELIAQGIMSMYLHMDTPRDTCVERVKGRREKNYQARLEKARLNGKSDPVLKEFSRKNLDLLYTTVERQWDKTVNLGLPIKKISSEPDIGKFIVGIIQNSEKSN